jgi:hypothetical protein
MPGDPAAPAEVVVDPAEPPAATDDPEAPEEVAPFVSLVVQLTKPATHAPPSSSAAQGSGRPELVALDSSVTASPRTDKSFMGVTNESSRAPESALLGPAINLGPAFQVPANDTTAHDEVPILSPRRRGLCLASKRFRQGVRRLPIPCEGERKFQINSP